MNQLVQIDIQTDVKISAVDLFCGVGGLTHGLVRGGIQVAAGVDLDPNSRFPFEENNAAQFIERDVSLLQASEIRPYLSQSDFSLLAGCAPCQPFSTYSRSGRNSQYETQWPLALAFGSLVNKLKPDLVAMENVPQLADHNVFQDFVKSLKGYHTWWAVVDCSLYGIPQTRKRLVLLASRLGSVGLKLEPTHSKAVTVRDTIAGLPSIRAGEKDSSDAMHYASSLSELNLRRIEASTPGGTWRDWPEELQAACHKKATGATYPSVYGRMEWDKPGPTITTQCFGFGNGRFGHPEQSRAISLREAAMLQTFPANYKFVPSGTPIRFNKMGRLIGNAVPVRLGEVIAQALISHVNNYR
ncbi:DNA cytosine methyltransferase [Pseudomonas sp. P1.8]|uniref:DNA cytosine methyltransferase n=1 Tax=Pseudomonas sp. P1.8 TaxID=1699310 RepID=UPI000A980B95|nr:DNA cytosine methyltransferase [Pseudomonas sp. P1.8]